MLPPVVRPEYSTTIPSTGRKIKYNPFTVKEEKVLVLASESGDQDEITNAVVNILNTCISSPSDVRAEDLALFDIEYLFLKTRAKSVGEKISINITDPDDETFTTPYDINIDSIRVEKTEGHTSLVDITDDVKVQMRYPDISFFADGINLLNITSSIEVMTRCIESIIVGDEVYNRTDMSTEEMVEWIESLTTAQYRSLVEFFSTMPKLRHTITCRNTNTKKDFSITLEGLADFF